MADDNEESTLAKQDEVKGEILSLGDESILNLDGLPEETKIELRKKYGEGIIELQKKAMAAGIDGKAINQRMGDITEQVAKATADQSSATVTGSYNDSLGRTEVIMGNTETAQKGKLSRSQRGEEDNTLKYVLIAIGVIIVLVFIFKN